MKYLAPLLFLCLLLPACGAKSIRACKADPNHLESWTTTDNYQTSFQKLVGANIWDDSMMNSVHHQIYPGQNSAELWWNTAFGISDVITLEQIDENSAKVTYCRCMSGFYGTFIARARAATLWK